MAIVALCSSVKYGLLWIVMLVLPALVTTALIDRMGDIKDRVRDEAQNLTLKLMDEVAPPMVGLR